ncbi:MAG TPA: cell division protein CrgA [Acidimicrobiales bacterium]|nr:cell division protein CrgA [Acidimicrobiales bacterium]
MATKTNSGPGGASRKGKSASGRASAKVGAKVGRYKTAEESGRYTPPIPKNVRRSPAWYGPLVLGLLVIGVLIIVLNYLSHLPGVSHGSAIGLVVGLALIFVGFLMATRYH